MTTGLKRTTGTLSATLLVLLLLPCATAQAGAVTAADFAEGKLAIGSIAVLPPQAEMTTRKVGADDSMIAESRQLEVYGLENTVSLLKGKGYKIVTIGEEDLAQNSELQELIRLANDRFDEEYIKLATRPGQLKKGRYTVGEEAQQLAEYLGVDAIVFERIYMEAAAAGQMAMALLIGGSSGGAKFAMTLVNGSDGRVVGYYDALQGLIGEDAATNKAEQMVVAMAGKALKKFPANGAVASTRDDDAQDDQDDSMDEGGAINAGMDESDKAHLEELELLLQESVDGSEAPANGAGAETPEASAPDSKSEHQEGDGTL